MPFNARFTLLVLSLNSAFVFANNDAEFSKNPVDIPNQIEQDREDKSSLFTPVERFLQGWDEFKDELDQQHGLQFSVDYQALYQGASSSPNESNASSGWASLFASWDLLGRETDHPGKLGFKIESRHALGTEIQPMALGGEAGSAWSTATGWTKFDTSVVELWWEQHLVKDHFAFRVGKILPFALYDYSRFKSPKTGFLNQAFNVTPATPFASFGLGIALLARPTDALYFVAGLHDANGKPTEFGFDSFFEKKEYFSVVEFGWDPGNLSGQRNTFFDGSDYHITLWHADERKKVGKPSGQGLTLAMEQPIMNETTIFTRYGYSDSTVTKIKHLLSTGISVDDLFGHKSGALTFGASWGQDHQQNEQYALEAFYRIQLMPRISITPDVQVVFNPIANPTKEHIAYFGLRGRVNF